MAAGVGSRVEAEGVGVGAASWPLLRLPRLVPWLWTLALGPPGPQRWLTGLKAPESDEGPVMFNQASSELWEGA